MEETDLRPSWTNEHGGEGAWELNKKNRSSRVQTWAFGPAGSTTRDTPGQRAGSTHGQLYSRKKKVREALSAALLRVLRRLKPRTLTFQFRIRTDSDADDLRDRHRNKTSPKPYLVSASISSATEGESSFMARETKTTLGGFVPYGICMTEVLNIFPFLKHQLLNMCLWLHSHMNTFSQLWWEL